MKWEILNTILFDRKIYDEKTIKLFSHDASLFHMRVGEKKEFLYNIVTRIQ